MKQIRASYAATDHIRKSILFDPKSVKKLKEIREHFREVHKIDVTDAALIRRSLDNYYGFVKAKLVRDCTPNLIIDEPDKVYRVAQPGNGQYLVR